jgi:hypothetical protein
MAAEVLEGEALAKAADYAVAPGSAIVIQPELATSVPANGEIAIWQRKTRSVERTIDSDQPRVH